MAEKARMFHDEEMLSLILEAKQPKAMKAYGRSVRNFDKGTWDHACYGIVKQASMAKFSQNPELWEFLRSTRNRILVEASQGTATGESVWERAIRMRNAR